VQRATRRALLAAYDQEELDMPLCKECGNEADELLSVKVSGRAKKLCEDCADRAREESEVAEASESVVQNMMGFKGRR
jgi:predicted sulfurtransferase